MDFIYKESLSNWIENFLDEGVFTTDENLRIILWNRWLEQRSSISSEKALGKKIFELFPEIGERRADRYFYQALNGQPVILSQRFHKYLLALPPSDEFSEYFTKMQQTVSITPLLSGMDVIGTITMIEDVTERVYREMLLKKEAEASRRAEEVAKKERDLAQHYLNIAGVMLLILDVNGDIRLINRKGCQILGCNQEDIIGKNWFETFITEKDFESIRGAFESIIRGDIEPYSEYENLIKTKSGEIKIIRWNNTVLKDESGRITGTLSSGEDITEKRRLEEALKSMSITDELTGLYNRRGFLALTRQQVKIAERAGNSMLLFFADLDNMKYINDTFGHSVGDEALKRTAEILKETFRESDIISRLGGDEFAVLALDARETVAETLYKRINDNISRHNKEGGDVFKLSLSIGFSRFEPDKPKDIDGLIADADMMMYREKKRKKQQADMEAAIKVGNE